MINTKWVESLDRLAQANARANRERLRRLSLREAMQEFESLCAEVHEQFPDPQMPKSHPVGLVRYWIRR